MPIRYPMLFFAAIVVGASYFGEQWLALDAPIATAWKGAGVALLAVWAGLQAVSTDGKLLAAVLALGALGDVLLETHGLTVGAVAFLAGHLAAATLYFRNARAAWWLAIPVAVCVAGFSWLLPTDRGAAPGVAFYALSLGLMAGAALISRFRGAAIGALLFVLSDLLIFARTGPLAGYSLPSMLVWPTYFAGQALIAWSVTTRLAGLARRGTQ